jgi:hypothetical protein
MFRGEKSQPSWMCVLEKVGTKRSSGVDVIRKKWGIIGRKCNHLGEVILGPGWNA